MRIRCFWGLGSQKVMMQGISTASHTPSVKAHPGLQTRTRVPYRFFEWAPLQVREKKKLMQENNDTGCSRNLQEKMKQAKKSTQVYNSCSQFLITDTQNCTKETGTDEHSFSSSKGTGALHDTRDAKGSNHTPLLRSQTDGRPPLLDIPLAINRSSWRTTRLFGTKRTTSPDLPRRA